MNETKRIVLEFGWIFREQPIVDVGIDAHIEYSPAGHPTGQLIAVQIKTGPSYFRDTGDHYSFRGELVHLDYWINHSLPVILVGHLPDSKETVWARIGSDTIRRIPTGWCIDIPKTNVFGKEAKEILKGIFNGTPMQQLLRKLSIDEPLMRHIISGGKVLVELEDWIHKSLGRTPVTVFIQDENGNDSLMKEWFVHYAGYGIESLAGKLFPWASISIDEDYYEIHEDKDMVWYGDFDGPIDFSVEFDQGYDSQERSIRPYSNSSGEVDHYRLQLGLNDIGRGFIAISNYLSL
nr:DUF4365 domain-containing protein [Armatimonas sp.]